MPAWDVNTFISIYGKCFALTPCGNIVIIVIFQKTKVLVRQAKLVITSWMKSQPDKVSRPSEPSLALIR